MELWSPYLHSELTVEEEMVGCFQIVTAEDTFGIRDLGWGGCRG